MVQYFFNRVNLTVTFLKLLVVMSLFPFMLKELGEDIAQAVLMGTVLYICFQTFSKIKKSLSLANHPESEKLTVVAYSPAGFDPLTYDASIGPSYDRMIPIYQEQLEKSVRNWNLATRSKFIFNGRKLALTSYSVKERFGKRPSIVLGFSENDYVTQRAVSDVFCLLPENEQSKVLKNHRFSPSKFFSRSFGVSLCVISSDNKIVLVRRSHLVSVNANLITCAVSEGMDMDDVRFGRPCIFKNAIRGIKEELGIILDDSSECVRITALALNEERYEWLAMGYVDFRDIEGGKYTSDYIAKNWQENKGLDSNEISEMFFIPFDREEVATYLQSHKKDLVNYTYTVVAHTLNDLLPVKGVRK